LLRIAQEAVTNAVRHGQARTLHVLLGSTSDGQLRLEIRDDGRGFAGEHAFSLQAGHYGLIGLRERADRMGAQLTLDSRPAEGTRIVVELPAQH
jgi:signal transduction histidine kinase